MRRFILQSVALFFLLTLFVSKASAAVLYSNNFISSFSNFSQFFGSCSPSPSGLVCTDTDAFYNVNLPTMKCVSADMNLNNIRDGLFFYDGIFTTGVGFAASGLLTTNDGHLHAYASGSTDSDLGINTPFGSMHNYEICKNSDTYTFYLDSSLIGTENYTGHSGGYFGFEAKSGTIITNLIATDSIPTPTPTLPPVQLSVPQIKQFDLPSGSQEYDSAKKWYPSSPFISTWGCALTAADMVMKYFGINTLPNNTPLTPGTLNTWLKSQPDGYIGNGLFNWLAVSRLTRLIRLAFNNPGFTADALQYNRINTADTTTLLADLQNNQPDILEEPGHFVVGTGTQGNTFTINDPYFPKNTLNDGYNNTFLSLGRYTPSHTDLSYILLVGPQDIDFSMKDSSGSAVGEEFVQQPFANPTNPSILSGPPVKLFYLTQPGNNTYTLAITSPSGAAYTAQTYDYDSLGNVQVSNLTGSGSPSNPDVFNVTFSKTDTKQDSFKKKSIFDTIFADASTFYKQNQIKKGMYDELQENIKDAQEQYNKQHIVQEKISLAETLIKLILWDGSHSISDNVYQTLVADITYLLTH